MEESRRLFFHRHVLPGRNLIVDNNLEDNDDEAERIARRASFNELIVPSSLSRNEQNQLNSLTASVSFNLTSNELCTQISECIKLNTENKINDKNAFQLKLIDFLVYALKKHDPNMSNLQMATASLDASTKIYGCRVDKVHDDLLKIIGIRLKRGQQNEIVVELDQGLGNEDQLHPKKKKKKNQQIIFLSLDKLKGKVETYDQTAFVECPKDTQTSDMLIQAHSYQHTNQGVLLNIYNDVILDCVENVSNKCKFLVTTIDDFQNREICPSYANFKFSSWSLEDEELEGTNIITDQMEESTDFHFDLDAAIPDNDLNNENIFMDCDKAYEERLNQQQSGNVNIVDFQDIIANNANPNTSFEYSYLQKSYCIKWAGPSHWRLKFNHHLGNTQTVEVCKQKKKNVKKVLELSQTEDSKKEAEAKFETKGNNTKIYERNWSEEKLILPNEIKNSIKCFHNFYNKSTEWLRLCGDREENIQVEAKNCISLNADQNTSASIDFGNDDICGNNNYFEDNINQSISSDNAAPTLPQSKAAFVGDNLVCPSEATNKIFIPYSQRAKRIDMYHLKKVMWRNLKESSTVKETSCDSNEILEASNKIDSKRLSNVYMEIPEQLSNPYAESLSPGLAFVALLHLGHEKNLKIDQTEDLSDIGISNYT